METLQSRRCLPALPPGTTYDGVPVEDNPLAALFAQWRTEDATDITGTAAGIARGFGSHLPLDLGSDGFQIQEIPSRALRFQGRPAPAGELDDYDDDDSQNGKDDSRDLQALSIPGVGAVRPSEPDPDAPGPYLIHEHRPHTATQAADSSERE